MLEWQHNAVSWRIRVAIAVAASLSTAVLYLLPNHFPGSGIRRLPLTAVDHAVPFIPDSAWIYFTDYFMMVAAFMLIRGAPAVARFCIAFFSMSVVGAVVHVAFPTEFPRELFPLIGTGHPLTEAVLARFRELDTPASCLPSMHVASCYFAALTLRDQHRRLHGVFLVWATAVAVSTLTTKQHYAIDLVAGLALALGVFAVFYRWLPSRLGHLAREDSLLSTALFGYRVGGRSR